MPAWSASPPVSSPPVRRYWSRVVQRCDPARCWYGKSRSPGGKGHAQMGAAVVAGHNRSPSSRWCVASPCCGRLGGRPLPSRHRHHGRRLDDRNDHRWRSASWLGRRVGAHVPGLLTISARHLFTATADLITLVAAGLAAQAVAFIQQGPGTSGS